MLEELVRNEDSLVIASLFAAGITAIVVFGCGWVVVSLAKIFTDGRLKRLMIDREMTAEEIERVVRAGSEESSEISEKPKGAPPRKPNPHWVA